VATVVRVAGSAYRRPGAKLLILESGETVGSVSGGCLEADVREVARGVIETGRPVLRHYDASDDEDLIGSLGMGCNGEVDIFIQPATTGPFASLTESLDRRLQGDTPITIATQIADGHVFTEELLPPPHLVICGAGADSIPLVAYAADAGFRVTLLDHREGLLDPSLFPRATRRAVAHADDPELVLPPSSRTLAVVKTHSFVHDRDWTRLLLGVGVPYVGVLGPKERTARILRAICDADHDRVFGPVGLDIGADGPRQIAISIVAELLAFVSKRQPLPKIRTWRDA
jgi:xanthine dehydrogenase accessory factor